jgi:4-hydroxy-tetrahydrodipicolinate synthase
LAELSRQVLSNNIASLEHFMQFHGIIPPVATPMKDDEALDVPRFRWFLDYLVGQGVHGVFVLATNSEFYALDEREKQELLAAAVAHVAGRVPVLAGTGAESTREALRLTRIAEREGADGVSIITPYYISPTQEEIFAHYRAIAESTRLPVILYNNPAMAGGVALRPETVARLAELPNVLGIKDSSGDLQNANEYIRLTPAHFAVLQGRDTLIYASLACGAKGAVPASANVAPALCIAIYDAWIRGDHAAALAAQGRLDPVRLSLQWGTAPGAVKTALALLGQSIGPSRMPVMPASRERQEMMRAVLRKAGLLR